MSSLYSVIVSSRNSNKLILELEICHYDEYEFYEEKVFALRILRSSYFTKFDEKLDFLQNREANGYLEMKKAREIIEKVTILKTENYPREYDTPLNPAPKCLLEIVVYDTNWIQHLEEGMKFETAAYAGTGGEDFNELELRDYEDFSEFQNFKQVEFQALNLDFPIFFTDNQNNLYFSENGKLDFNQSPIQTNFRGFNWVVSYDGKKLLYLENFENEEDDEFFEYYVCCDYLGNIIYKWEITTNYSNQEKITFLPDSNQIAWIESLDEIYCLHVLNLSTFETKIIAKIPDLNDFFWDKDMSNIYININFEILKFPYPIENIDLTKYKIFENYKENSRINVELIQLKSNKVKIPYIGINKFWGENYYYLMFNYSILPENEENKVVKLFHPFDFTFFDYIVYKYDMSKKLEFWFASGKEADEGVTYLNDFESESKKIFEFIQGIRAVWDINVRNWYFLPTNESNWVIFSNCAVKNDQMNDSVLLNLDTLEYNNSIKEIIWPIQSKFMFFEEYNNMYLCVPKIDFENKF